MKGKQQKTINETVEIEGQGLFTGQDVRLRFLPATPGTGISFVRTDLSDAPKLQASIENAKTKYRRTALKKEEAEVDMVEHLMAAIWGLGITNLEVEINGSEVPGMDGSAKPFVDVLQSAQIVEQDRERKDETISDSVSVQEDDSTLTAIPGENDFEVSFTLEYDHPVIGSQHLTLPITPETFAREIAPARTFCPEEEVDKYLKKGLGKGASYENSLIVGKDGVKENELRFSDEFVRHKILDLIGDMALLGTRFPGHIMAVRTGHSVNLKLVRKLHQEIYGTTPAEEVSTDSTMLDLQDILGILPHRYPFLLVDRVIELDGYDRAVGIKNVTYNEPFFQGHFPGKPVMPGVLQIEAMAQLAGALLLRKAENVDKLAFLLSLDNVKLRKTVIPGDQLRLVAEGIKIKSRTGLVKTYAKVNDETAAEAKMKFMLIPEEQKYE